MTDKQKTPDATALARRLRQGLGLMALGLRNVAGAGARLTLLWLRRAIGMVLALIILFEQWGWQYLLQLFSGLAHLVPVVALERWISRLPPYAALAAFGLPTALLLPLKLLALYLIAHGHALAATALFIGAKIVGTAVVARLYQLTEPQLMKILWVRRVHDFAAPRLHALHDEIRRSWGWRYGRMLKTKAKHTLAPVLARLKARLVALISRG
jgi:hypothetical protein